MALSQRASRVPGGVGITGITADELAARAAIATSLARHGRGVDRTDVALLRSAWHPHATVDYGVFDGAAHDVAAVLTDAMAGGPVTLHRTSNMAIRVEGARGPKATSSPTPKANPTAARRSG